MRKNLGYRICASLTIVMLVAPANAHCYKHWYYPYPQSCGRGETGRHMGLKIPQRIAMRVQVPPPAPEDKGWYVEIVKEPEEIGRDKAVELLKKEMHK